MKQFFQLPWTKISKFKKGALLSVTLSLNNNLDQNIIGICTERKYKGFDSWITLKYVINGETIFQRIPLYSPFVKKIQILKN